MLQHLFQHFNAEERHFFLDKISIIFTDPSEPSKKKKIIGPASLLRLYDTMGSQC